jgi:hypothetical protein
MSEINVNGRIRVKSFQASFIEKFPYLLPTLRMPDGAGISNELTIAGARGLAKGGPYTPTGEAAMSINGNLTVGGFEKRFKDAFGVECEILYRLSGKHYKTKEEYDALSLAAANKKLEERGAEKIQL